MKENPIKGDWIKLIKKDLEVIEMSLEHEEQMTIMSTKEFKTMVKEKIRIAAFKELEEKKATHEKVREVLVCWRCKEMR